MLPLNIPQVYFIFSQLIKCLGPNSRPEGIHLLFSVISNPYCKLNFLPHFYLTSISLDFHIYREIITLTSGPL